MRELRRMHNCMSIGAVIAAITGETEIKVDSDGLFKVSINYITKQFVYEVASI